MAGRGISKWPKKFALVRIFLVGLHIVALAYTGTIFASTNVERARAVVGKLINKQKFETADTVLKRLVTAGDAPSMHLRAVLIIRGVVVGDRDEAVALLCKAKLKNYSISDLVLERINRNCNPPLPEAPPDLDSKKSSLPLNFVKQWLTASPKPGYQLLGNGSGAAITDQGVFITNHHVVDQCSALAVKYNGLIGLAEVISINKELDFALLKVDAPSPYYARFDGSKYALGETLYAAGFPMIGMFGEDLKLSRGLLMSARDDKRGDLPSGILLTDIPVGNGSSGGPVLTEAGLLRGIVVAFWSWDKELKSNEGGRMSQNPTAVISGLAILKYLKGSTVPLYPVDTNNNIVLRATEIAEFAKKITARVECLSYD
jgi:S1-C subfamily serine protease